MTAVPLQRDIYYPESDGQPMAETDLHRDEMYDLIHALRERYQDVPDVYVSGNLFFYYVQGDPRAVVAPDVLLVKGVPKGQRRIYKLWEEGRVPSLVIELTSDSTRNEDLSKKKLCYERLGVEEYFLHDPYGDYLNPNLWGYRLVEDRYQRIEPEPDGSLRSLATDLLLRTEGTALRLLDAVRGRSSSPAMRRSPASGPPERRLNGEPSVWPRRSPAFAARWKAPDSTIGAPTRLSEALVTPR